MFDCFTLRPLLLGWFRHVFGLSNNVNVDLSLGAVLLQHLVLSLARPPAQLDTNSALTVSLDSLETLKNSEN